MTDEKPLIYTATVDLLVSAETNKLRYPALSQPVQYEIVCLVEQASLAKGSIDMTTIAILTDHSRNTIKKQTSNLEKNGYITISADNSDYRRKILRPTNKLKDELDKYAESLSPLIAKSSYRIQAAAWAKWTKNH